MKKKFFLILLVVSFGVLSGCNDSSDEKCIPYHVCGYPDYHEECMRGKSISWWKKFSNRDKIIAIAVVIAVVSGIFHKK